MKQKEQEEEAIQKQYDKQCAVNSHKLKELADKHNEYQVLLSFLLDSFLMGLTFVVQTEEYQEPPKSVQQTQFATNQPVANPFEIFKTHATMQTINAHLVPCLIADFGSNYANVGNNKMVTAIIAHVIMTEELGGYTEQTFPEMIHGYHVHQLAFTKFVLRQISISLQTFVGR